MDKNKKNINVFKVGFLILIVILIVVFGYFEFKKNSFGQINNNQNKQKENLENKGDKDVYKKEKIYTPKEYQKILGIGMDVDWAKSKKEIEFYNKQVAIDFKNRGFSHVRIRTRDKEPKDILKQLKRVVDDSLSVGLIPIIAYKADDFKKNPSKEEMKSVINWWREVAYEFKDYPSELSFDIIIEVTDELSKKPKLLNNFYEKVVREIRKTNPNRIIFISPVVRSAPEKLELLKIPSTSNGKVMVEWHFCASGPSKTNPSKLWTTGTKEQKDIILKKIKIAKDWEEKTGIKTWVGAWMPGNYNKGNNYSVKEQMEFARFVSKELINNKIPFSVNSSFKFYDEETNTWISALNPVLDVIFNSKK